MHAISIPIIQKLSANTVKRKIKEVDPYITDNPEIIIIMGCCNGGLRDIAELDLKLHDSTRFILESPKFKQSTDDKPKFLLETPKFGSRNFSFQNEINQDNS